MVSRDARCAHELRQRGVDDELVQEALDDPELGDELETARTLARRRLAAVRDRLADPLERERQLRRVLGMLARKGYGAGVAGRAVREALAETDAETDELADLEADLEHLNGD